MRAVFFVRSRTVPIFCAFCSPVVFYTSTDPIIPRIVFRTRFRVLPLQTVSFPSILFFPRIPSVLRRRLSFQPRQGSVGFKRAFFHSASLSESDGRKTEKMPGRAAVPSFFLRTEKSAEKCGVPDKKTPFLLLRKALL